MPAHGHFLDGDLDDGAVLDLGLSPPREVVTLGAAQEVAESDVLVAVHHAVVPHEGNLGRGGRRCAAGRGCPSRPPRALRAYRG